MFDARTNQSDQSESLENIAVILRRSLLANSLNAK